MSIYFVFWNQKTSLEILKALKVFLYIFLIMLALVLLKGLSTFEYSLRDKTIKYNDVLIEEFDSTDKGFFSSLKKGNDKEVSYLKIDLGNSDSMITYPPIYKGIIESKDSGYIEIRYRAELDSNIVVNLNWSDRNNAKHSILSLDQNFTDFKTFRTDFIPFSDFLQLEIGLPKQESLTSIEKDSLEQNRAPFHRGYVYLDNLKFVAAIKEKPLF